ncbi:MAG: hypothetical protein K9G76_11650 [Bacteroidales bacterium]|nr:hypothetical protein [Bacteroidales bacterium]MCF8405097.1 hypothetical protein [Bacteroidales bacterium]
MIVPGKAFFHLLIVFILFSTGAKAQNIPEFSDDSEKFLSELNSMFSKVNIKEDRKECEDMMERFTEYWNAGNFSRELKQNIKHISNLMLNRRMKAFPQFFYYYSCNMSLMDLDHSQESYDAWHKSIDKLVQDKRSTKPFKDFLEISHSLLHKNILYQSRATQWRSSTYEYSFVYDSVPKVIFNDLNLICQAYQDSSVIYNTKGIYYPIDKEWVGEKGKVDWSRAGYDKNTVYAELSNYHINLNFSRYSADSVKFYHKDYWEKPLLGSFEEKVLANVSEEKATYPQFISYFDLVEIKDVFKDMDFKGGIEVRGRKFIGISVGDDFAELIIKKDKKEFMKVLSDNYVIYPDKIVAALATTTIYHDQDSIFHPGLKFSYVDENKELSLVRAGDGTSTSPYYDSFHNLDIYAEAIYWKMDEPFLNFETVKGASGMGRAVFESSSYFSKPRYLRLQGIDPLNPLDVVRNYVRKYNVSEVSVQGLAEEMLIPQDQVIGMLVNLSNQGFVIYERESHKARVKDKLFEYIEAVNKKRDYDVIQFNSETYGFQNASLELDSFDLKVFGVPIAFLSDSQNVFIFPSNKQLIIKQGMDFSFSGRVHAGTFDFHAQGVQFNYDQFKLDMPAIDSVSFSVPSFETDQFGQRKQKKVRNVLSNLAGDLYIDDPNNKSGLKNFPAYPIFQSTKDAYVYYDSPEIFNGVYKRDKFYFYLYPFTIDSLDNFKTELLQFEGYLASAGIFPDIEDTLRVQRDYSLGFETFTPESGFDAYGGKGTYYADIRLSNEGLRGKGYLEYLTSTSWSDDYQFFPDSTNTLADKFVIEEQFTNPEYPAVSSVNVFQHWIPYKDRMVVRSTDFPIDMFNSQSELQGKLVLTPLELRGIGKMSFEDAAMESKLFTYKQHEIFADSADFKLESIEYIQSAFATKNYKSHIDFDERKGEFVSNGGASFVDFPVNQYICLIDEFDWYMDSYQIAIGSEQKEAEMAKYNNLSIRELIDVPLQGSEFISIHPDQDSLRFVTTTANYNLKSYILYAEDVKYIRVADAAIFPADRKIVINPEAKLNTIADAKILANTVTRYHEIYDAVVDIKGRKNYNGIGNYDYVDENKQRQQVFLKKLSVDATYQSIGNGSVSDTMGFKLNKDFYFTGNINLSANNEFLNFDGGFKIREQCTRGLRKWVKFNTDIDPDEIYINIAKDLFTLKQEKLESAIMFSNEQNKFYSGFLDEKQAPSDQKVFAADGFIRYDRIMDQYDIGSQERLKGLTLEGNQLSLSRKQCILKGKGALDLGASLGRVKLDTYGQVNYYMIPDSASFEVVQLFDFPFDNKALEIMTEEINMKNLQGLNTNTPVFIKALNDIMGAEKAEKIVSDLSLFGKFRKFPDELKKTLVFGDLKFKWNYATRSFISYGKIGLSSIGKDQVNKYVNGTIEIARKRTGDVVNIYIEFDNGKSWYFFNYRNNLMQTISSNMDYNNYIRELKDDKRTVKKDKEGEEYSFIISNLRKKTDFLRMIQQ